MKKTKGRVSGHHGKIYMNLALSSQPKDVDGTRPYGGRKGIPNRYPPSKAVYLSEKPTDFLNDVKNMVFRQTEEEERSGSPSWIGKYNKELNHTGEQPLMVQRFLSNNKQEQQDGVLPASSKSKSRFHVDRENNQEFHQGLSLHQYLTATEMPGQSEKLVDVRHGRPTRTSLLRARQRTKNIPGPEKTKLDLREDIHYLQEQTMKREDKYKSVDVPEDLQPVTEGEETVHQFLVGARYNRAYYRDAKCFNKVGLYVSRENPQHCFLKNGITQESLLGNKTEKANNPPSHAFSDVTASELNSLCQSTSSIQSSAKHLQPPSKARQAWGTSSVASAPSPTPNDSRESFAHSSKDDPDLASNDRSRNDSGGKSKPTDRGQVQSSRRLLIKNAPGQQSSSSSVSRSTVSDSCVLCQEGAAVKQGVPVHFHGRNIMSAPSRRKWTHHAQRGRNLGSENNLPMPKRGQSADLMLVQQYHLRILGTQSLMNVKEDRCHSPESKLHYTPRQTASSVPRPKTAAPSSRRNPNRNNNNRMEDLAEEGASERKGSDAASTTSKISVHISTGGDDVAEDGSPRAGAMDNEATPRSQDVTVGSTRDGGESMADLPTPRTVDLLDQDPGAGEEVQDSNPDCLPNIDQSEPKVSNEQEVSDSQLEEFPSKVESIQDASDVPRSQTIEEDEENNPEGQVTGEGVMSLQVVMAQVNLDNGTEDASEEHAPRESIEEDSTKQIETGIDVVVADGKLKSQASDIDLEEKEPTEVNNNNNSQARTVTFAEPDR